MAETKAVSGSNVSIDLAWVTGPSRIYIVEFFTVLVSLGLILYSGIGLFGSLIDHLMGDDVDALSVPILTIDSVVLNMSIALFAVPAFVLFYTRTRKAERKHTKLLDSRARRRLGYVFLMITALFMIGFSVAFVYNSLLTVAESNVGSTGESWIHTSLKQVFSLSFLATISLLVAKLLPGLDGGRNA